MQQEKIILNVGGTIFETTKSTLLGVPNTFFSAMFSKQFDTKPDETGEYFIDRDAKYFDKILNYLRNPGKPICLRHLTAEECVAFFAEVDCYCIADLQPSSSMIATRAVMQKNVTINRMQKIVMYKYYNGYDPDYLSFTCNKDARLLGVAIFVTPNSHYDCEFEIFDSDAKAVKYSQQYAKVSSASNMLKLMLHSPMYIPANVTFTMSCCLTGDKSEYCSSDICVVESQGLQLTFSDNPTYYGNLTSMYDGQFPELYFQMECE